MKERFWNFTEEYGLACLYAYGALLFAQFEHLWVAVLGASMFFAATAFELLIGGPARRKARIDNDRRWQEKWAWAERWRDRLPKYDLYVNGEYIGECQPEFEAAKIGKANPPQSGSGVPELVQQYKLKVDLK